MPSTKLELYQEARRCEDAAAERVSPVQSRMYSGLARFYETLARLDPEPKAAPKHRAPRLDLNGGRSKGAPHSER